MTKRGKDVMLQFMKEPDPLPALLRHRAGYRSFAKPLCAMATALVLASLTSTAAAGSGKMSRIGSFAGDTGAKVVVPYRPAVEALAFGVRNGPDDYLPGPAFPVAGQWQPHPHLTLASAQNKPVEQKISIKPHYARMLCALYARGDFDKLQRYIQRKWKGLYRLEDIYLSLRCERYDNLDLLRISHANPNGALSLIKLDRYFRKLSEKKEGDSLLSKVLYCKENYRYMRGRVGDYFDYLEHVIELWQKRKSAYTESEFAVIIRSLVKVRELVSAHVRDFPFPAARLELGPGEAREYRRKWCREHFPP